MGGISLVGEIDFCFIFCFGHGFVLGFSFVSFDLFICVGFGLVFAFVFVSLI